MRRMGYKRGAVGNGDSNHMITTQIKPASGFYKHQVGARVIVNRGTFAGNKGTIISKQGMRLRVLWDDGNTTSCFAPDAQVL